jgi:hypothetical protein
MVRSSKPGFILLPPHAIDTRRSLTLKRVEAPRPPMPLSTLQETPRDVPCKTRGQDGFTTSFPVGLLHPLQHAGLARRSPN